MQSDKFFYGDAYEKNTAIVHAFTIMNYNEEFIIKHSKSRGLGLLCFNSTVTGESSFCCYGHREGVQVTVEEVRSQHGFNYHTMANSKGLQ